MGKIKRIFKNWIVFLVLLIGLVIILPQIYLVIDLGNKYHGIKAETGDAELHYLARIQEVYDGHWKLGNTFLKNKNLPFLQPPLPEIIVALIGKFFFLDASQANILAKFLFSAVLYVILYFLFNFIFKNKLYSIFSATFMIMASMYLPYIKSLLIIFFPHQACFNALARPIIPLFDFIFLFGFIFSFLVTLKRNSKILIIISSIILGITFYVYFYTITFLLATLTLLLGVKILRKDWVNARKILIIISLAVIIALPYFINFYQSANNPNYGSLSQRFGLVEGRELLVGKMVPLLIILFLFFFPRRDKNLFDLGLVLSLATLFAQNQQLITGRMMQPNHYYWNLTKPIFAFIILIILFFWAEKLKSKFLKKHWIKYALVLGIIFFTVNCTLNQLFAYKKNKDYYIDIQRYGPILSWMKDNLPKDSMVWSNEKIVNYISAYTSLNSNSPYAVYYLLDPSEIQSLTFLKYKIKNISPDKAKKLFKADERATISHLYYGMYFRKKYGRFENIPNETIDNILDEYQKFYSQDLAENLKILSIDYILWDGKEEKKNYYKENNLLEKIYQDEKNNFVIYKVL